MKRIFYTILSLLLIQPSFAQYEQNLPPEAYNLYPTLSEMYGFAVGTYEDKILVLGGRIRSDIPELYSEDFPNTEILLIDLGEDRATAFSSGALEGILGEQLAATGLGYFQDDNTLYIMGGYGYSETHNRFITFPYITGIDVSGTIDALLKGENPVANFYQLCDDNMAIFNSLMDYNGDEYFLINGKFAYKIRPFEEDAEYFEEERSEEVRTFRIEGDLKNLEVMDFRTWYDLEAFRDYYGPLLPEKIAREVEEILSRPVEQ